MNEKEYDEFEAIAFIRQRVSGAQDCSDDDLLLLIDTMFDYYDSLDDDATDDQYDVEFVAAFVARQLAKDKECAIPRNLVPELVTAELEYETTLDN
ncbi:MAG: hypothetical protein IJT30_06515 [Muribaculaceae bacterium]|nr:hypothetical protein [Muribaculaceae bacterium]